MELDYSLGRRNKKSDNPLGKAKNRSLSQNTTNSKWMGIKMQKWNHTNTRRKHEWISFDPAFSESFSTYDSKSRYNERLINWLYKKIICHNPTHETTKNPP